MEKSSLGSQEPFFGFDSRQAQREVSRGKAGRHHLIFTDPVRDKGADWSSAPLSNLMAREPSAA